MPAARSLRLVTRAVAALALAIATPTPVAAGETSQFDPYADSIATTFQMNAAHDGNSPLGAPPPPLKQLWSRTLPGKISYPVIAAGKVFVTIANPQDFSEGYGTKLYALDAATGEVAWGPIPLRASGFWSALSFGDGRLFAVDPDGQLRAFDPATGTVLWQRTLSTHINWFYAAPTFHDGLLYVAGKSANGGGRLYAVRPDTGATVWGQTVYSGDNSSPAVDASGVYVSYFCGVRHAFAPTTGEQLWYYRASCSTSGGRTPVLAAGRLWVREVSGPAYSVNPTDGVKIDEFASSIYRVTPPAFLGNTGFFMDRGVLRASDAATPATPIWTFTGDGRLTSAPIVVNGHVYVGSGSGQLWALDPATGTPVWTTNVGASIEEPYEMGGNPPLTGLAAGQGRLLVPASNTLVAYGQ